MKLLHVHDFFAPGNSRYGHDICRKLVLRGHEVHVLAAVGERGPADGAVVDGVRFHTYRQYDGAGAFKRYRYVIGRNKTIFSELQRIHCFDVVLFNQPLCYHGVRQSPIVAEVRRRYAFISPWADEWKAAHDPEGGGLFRGIARRVNLSTRNRMEGRALRECSGVSVISDFVKNRLLQLHPETPPEKLHSIPCAVDTDMFCPTPGWRERHAIPPGDTLLLTIRRLVPRMGVDNLIRAFPEVLASIPSARLVIGGEGPLRGELEALARSLPCADRVLFTGYVADAEMPAIYSAADLFLLPTKELEGFGMVIIEAMACGTPVLGTPVGAIPEVLGPFDRSMLCSGVGHREIAEGLLRLFRSGISNDDMRQRCRQYAVDRYGWDVILPRFESFLCGKA
ncbi:MAG: hypothetical protein A2Z34_02330 [Planctomycetes bacterium RBG_16_59_8]|nr:MAG: hypothetical protein A2Z34_02330 [Planctomycetes bacterium RBG_16_59_8]